MDGNTVIVTKYNNWFCKRCNKAHGALYISKDKERYCPECVPNELKKGAIKYKQNGELC